MPLPLPPDTHPTFMLGASTGYRTPGRCAMRASTSAASASCGTHLGDTKLVLSITGSPAAVSWSISCTLTSVETWQGSRRARLLSRRHGSTPGRRRQRPNLAAMHLFWLVLQPVSRPHFHYGHTGRQRAPKKLLHQFGQRGVGAAGLADHPTQWRTARSSVSHTSRLTTPAVDMHRSPFSSREAPKAGRRAADCSIAAKQF